MLHCLLLETLGAKTDWLARGLSFRQKAAVWAALMRAAIKLAAGGRPAERADRLAGEAVRLGLRLGIEDRHGAALRELIAAVARAAQLATEARRCDGEGKGETLRSEARATFERCWREFSCHAGPSYAKTELRVALESLLI